MESEFGCRIENMVMLYHTIIGYKMVQNEWQSGRKMTKKEVQTFKAIQKECEEIFNDAPNFPGAGEG
jgi:hypothetical protein